MALAASSGPSRALFPVVLDWATGEGDVASVTHFDVAQPGDFVEVQPDVFVPPSVKTEFDYDLPKGWYVVESLSGEDYDYVGESLDLAFLKAGLSSPGVYSGDVNSDFSISPVFGHRIKSEALSGYGIRGGEFHFAD